MPAVKSVPQATLIFIFFRDSVRNTATIMAAENIYPLKHVLDWYLGSDGNTAKLSTTYTTHVPAHFPGSGEPHSALQGCSIRSNPYPPPTLHQF